MGKEALYALIDQIDEKEIDHVYYFLSLVAHRPKKSFEGMVFEEVEPLPDEIEIIEEANRAKVAGEETYSFEEVFGKPIEYYRHGEE